jgi:hypothetical protein
LQTGINQFILSPLLFNPVGQFVGYFFSEGLSYSESVDRLRKNSADFTVTAFLYWSIVILAAMLQPNIVTTNLIQTIGGMIWGIFTPLLLQKEKMDLLSKLEAKLPKPIFAALNCFKRRVLVVWRHSAAGPVFCNPINPDSSRRLRSYRRPLVARPKSVSK